jgi:hypothetical protein
MPFEQVSASGSELVTAEKFQAFMNAVKTIIRENPERISEEMQAQILEEAGQYREKMETVSDPRESAQRLVMSRMTESHITE